MSLVRIIESGGCLGLTTAGDKHTEMDAYGKANDLTVMFAPWHPNPEYRIFKTGSLLSRNEEYPSGLIIVNEKGQTRRAGGVNMKSGADPALSASTG